MPTPKNSAGVNCPLNAGWCRATPVEIEIGAESMERSTGITLSAVIAIVGSSLLLFGGAVYTFVLQAFAAGEPSMAPMRPLFLSLGLCMLGFAGWGFATSVGLLRVQAWSRISIVVFSGLLTVACVISSIAALFDHPEFDASNTAIAAFVAALAILAVLIGLGVSWLCFFNSVKTKAQFRPARKMPPDDMIWLMWSRCACFLLLFSAAILRAQMPVTFSKDVAPIFFGRCAVCHHPNDIAPMSL